MGFANMKDFMTVDAKGQLADFDYAKLTRDHAAAIQEITVDTTGGAGDGERKLVLRTKFKLAPKRESLELLGKHLRLFTDKLEVSGSITLADAIAEARKRAKA
jgi:phage terminase small subunit